MHDFVTFVELHKKLLYEWKKNEPITLISNQLPYRKPYRVLPSRAITQAFSANLAVSGQYTRLFMGVLHGIS